MNTFYIPISTLDFNNVLSTESLSPRAFYAQRGFGYKRWQTIPENGKETIILLYEQPFCFSRPSSDVEDHPLLVEIQTDEDFRPLSEGIRYCDHTIYLLPWRTRFHFFSERVLRIALSLTRHSSETKLVPLYERRCQISKFPQKDYTSLQLSNIPSLNQEAIKRDIRLNKMKGLLYGYYIGSLLSVSPRIVNKLKELSRLRNLFFSLWSQSSYGQKYSGGTRFSFTSLGSDKDERTPLDLAMGMNDFLEFERRRLDEQGKLERYFLPTSEEGIVVEHLQLRKIVTGLPLSEKEEELVKTWANEVLDRTDCDGSLSAVREKLSDMLTEKAKILYGEKWEASTPKESLNQMRRFIRNTAKMPTWEEMPLAATLSVVLSKGDDWGKLLEALQEGGQTDYRTAFAIYGELIGFANLTCDFTDALFSLPNRKYVVDVYREIYRQLLSVDPRYPSETIVLEEILLDTPVMDKSHVINWKKQVQEYCAKNIKQMKRKREDLLKKTLKDCGEYVTPKKFLDELSKREGWGKRTKLWKDLEKFLKAGPQELPFESSAISQQKGEHIPFTSEHVNEIVNALSQHFSWEKEMAEYIKRDLEYVFRYVGKRDPIRFFTKTLEDEKVVKKPNKGNPYFENKACLYRNLNVPEVIDYIHLICENKPYAQ